MTRRWLGLLLLAALVSACAFRVEGSFINRELPAPGERLDRAILIIYNHGYSGRPGAPSRVPPILEAAVARNPDVIVFNQLRPMVVVSAVDHSLYVESAVARFQTTHGITPERIILAGQSCGGWGSLQAAAFTYRTIGGVLAFAPTCHGRLPHSPGTAERRALELDRLAHRIRFPGAIFLYEGDSYYDLGEWAGVQARLATRAPEMRIEQLSRARVLEVCPQCGRDSHGAVWGSRFASVYLDTHVQPVIDRIRDRLRAREARRSF